MTSRALSSAEWDLWHTWMAAQGLVVAQVDSALQSEVGISKAEFSILRTLCGAPDSTLRTGDLGAALHWEKSRVSHLLGRMESRGLVESMEDGAPGRRTAVSLSRHGHEIIQAALRVHEATVRRLFIDPLTVEQADAIRAWSEQTIIASRPAESRTKARDR